MTGARRSISLVKGRRRYVFSFYEGRETELLAAILELAARPESGFDFFDAAVLSHQMGRGMSESSGPALARAGDLTVENGW
jgi:hypothetical protein